MKEHGQVVNQAEIMPADPYPSWEESSRALVPEQRLAAEAAYFRFIVETCREDAKKRLPWLKTQEPGRKKQIINRYTTGVLDAYLSLNAGDEAVEGFRSTWGNKSEYYLRQVQRISPTLEQGRDRIFTEAKDFEPFDVEKITRETHADIARFPKEKRPELYDETGLSPEKTREIFKRWGVTIGANAVSVWAVDAIAAGAGGMLVKSNTVENWNTPALLGAFVASFGFWGYGMYKNIKANWKLLEDTGISSNALSKAWCDGAKSRTPNKTVQKVAAGVGYGLQEAIKEVPWAAGTAIAIKNGTLASEEGLTFYTGANVGAAAYEFGVAFSTNKFLDWRRRRINKVRPFKTVVEKV